LRTRRDRITPADVGLPPTPRRRTPGLRREDVADRAGMSVAWYSALEQARAVRVSDDMLDRLADALCLTPVERTYLARLARDGIVVPPEPPLEAVVTPALQGVLDSLDYNPAYIMNSRWDVLALNVAQARFTPGLACLGSGQAEGQNVVQFVFTDATWRRQVADWEQHARGCLAGFRESFADDPDDHRARALIEELRRVSPEFRRWWPRHELWSRVHHLPQVHDHPQVGGMTVENTLFQLRGAPRLTLVLHTPRDPASAEKLRMLGRGAPARATTAPGPT
jgi:transcriptional regulator with XRE-family HTH domain